MVFTFNLYSKHLDAFLTPCLRSHLASCPPWIETGNSPNNLLSQCIATNTKFFLTFFELYFLSFGILLVKKIRKRRPRMILRQWQWRQIHKVLVNGLVRFWLYCYDTWIADWFVCHCLKQNLYFILSQFDGY